MKTFISKNKWFRTLIIAAFWILIWQFFAIRISQEILLARPDAVFKRLLVLSTTWPFWKSVCFSLCKIGLGFIAGIIVGVTLAGLAALRPLIYEVLSPPLSVIKATPVASFTILALVWIKAQNLSVFISFLMVLPIIYFNTYEGIRQVDHKLQEMAFVFRVPFVKQLRWIYFKSILPYVASACAASLGFAWKSGIAAEVIGKPSDSIGINLYNAKIFLETADLLV